MPASRPRLGIVADDLTGALDSAATLAGPGRTVVVGLPDSRGVGVLDSGEIGVPDSGGGGVPDSGGGGVPDSRGIDVPDSRGIDVPDSLGADRPDIFALATGSRDLPWVLAAPRVRDALQVAIAAEPEELMLKVDSQLRGYPDLEVGLALELLGPDWVAIVAPAFPSHGRTTVGGIQLVTGSEGERRIDLVALFGASGLSVARLDASHSDPAAVGGASALPVGRLNDGPYTDLVALRSAGVRIIVADALVPDDLAAIVDAGRALGAVLWVGSAGLAGALRPMRPAHSGASNLARPAHSGASNFARPAHPDAPNFASARDPAVLADERDAAGPLAHGSLSRRPRILVVAGSAAPETDAQISALTGSAAPETDAQVAALTGKAAPETDAQPATLTADRAAHFAVGDRATTGVALGAVDLAALRTALSERSVAILRAPSRQRHVPLDSAHTSTLAQGVVDLMPAIDGLVVSGGETLLAVMTALGFESLVVHEELEPGVVLSRPAGSDRPLIVSKAGSFGDAGTLARAVSILQRRLADPG